MKIDIFCKCWIEHKSGRKLYYHRYIIDTVNLYAEIYISDKFKKYYRQIAYLIAPSNPVTPHYLSSVEEWNFSRSTGTGLGIERIVLTSNRARGVGYWCIYDSHIQSIVYANTVFSSTPPKLQTKYLDWELKRNDKLRDKLR